MTKKAATELTSVDYGPHMLDVLRRLENGEVFRACPPDGWRDANGGLVFPGTMYRLFCNGLAEFGPKQRLLITDAGREALHQT